MSTRKTRRSTRKQTLKEEFKDWANQLDIEVSIVEGRYNAILEVKKKTFPDLPEKDLTRIVRRVLKTDLKRDFGSLISKAPPVRGFWVGASELVNFIDLMRGKAERVVNATEDGFDEALSLNLINAGGDPLDTRKTMFGRANPTHGIPLDELPEKDYISAYRRHLYGIGHQKGSDFPQFYAVEFQREMALNLEYSLLTPVTWRANIVNEGVIVRQRASEAATRIRLLEDIVYEYEELIRKACEFQKLSGVSMWHLQNREDWDRVICAKGFAAAISDRPHPTTNSTMIIVDDDSLGFEDMGHRLYVPEHIPIEFGEESEIIFWGMTNTQKLRATDEEIIVTNVYGIYPLEKLRTPIGYKSSKRLVIEWDDAVE